MPSRGAYGPGGVAATPARGLDLLFIENVGNLVCPSSYELGEHLRVVVLSVTEGEDKPLKYPRIFRRAEVLVINKIDLLPYLDYDLAQARGFALQVNPKLTLFEVSCRTGEGLPAFTRSLEERVAAHRA